MTARSGYDFVVIAWIPTTAAMQNSPATIAIP
jgi:hypothetical protein